MRFSEHFDSSEFKHIKPAEHCRRVANYNSELLREALNERLCPEPWQEVALIVTSGVRTRRENKRVGGVRKSKHLEKYGGHALDIVARFNTGIDIKPRIVADEAAKLFDYVEAFKGYVHTDMRDTYKELTG